MVTLGAFEEFNLISSPWGSMADVWSSPRDMLGPNPPPWSMWSGLLGLKRWFWCHHALGCPRLKDSAGEGSTFSSMLTHFYWIHGNLALENAHF